MSNRTPNGAPSDDAPSNGGRASLTREPSPGKVRSDAITIIVMSALATAGVIVLAVLKFREMFTPEGLAWNLPVEPTTATAEGLRLYTPEGPAPIATVTGNVSRLEVIVPDAGAVASVALAVSILAAALTALIMIASTARLAWIFLRGRFFTEQASIALRTFTYAGAIGGVAALIAWRVGMDGVQRSLGANLATGGGLSWWSWWSILVFALVAFGLVDIALRRGIRLQRDTAGLV